MEPTEPQQHPIDYLDSISSAPKKSAKGPADLLFFGVLIGGLLIALLVGAFMLLGDGGGKKTDFTTLAVRLTNLQSVADNSKKNIVSSKLRATNTSLSLALTNANRDITDSLTQNGVESGKLDPKITAQENTDELNGRLEDARLNGIFDRIYAREMSYQVDTVLILIEQLESKARHSSQKEFLSATHANLKPLQEQLSKFDTTTN